MGDSEDRFALALAYAHDAHRGHVRKGAQTPYVGHLLGVCALVLEDGGDEDEAIAALLHDAVEDQGGPRRLADIHAVFGERVAEIVSGCTDTDIQPKPPWRPRKEAYIASLSEHSSSVLRVSLADKVYNARAILLDYRRLGEALWDRFDQSSDQIWYYRALVSAFREVSTSDLVDELDRAITELERLVLKNRQPI